MKISSLSDYWTLHESSGVIKVENNEEGSCFLSRNSWSTSRKNLSSFLDFEEGITLLDVDPYSKKLFWDKIVPVIMGTSQNNRKEALKNFSYDTLERVHRWSGIEANKVITHELIINPPYLETTAYNHAKKFKVGLHIDTHNTSSLDKRKEGFHLMGINLGSSPRYFLFAPYDVETMINLLKKDVKDFSHVRQLKDEFLDSFPNTSIMRLTVLPGQAYIAVSQNIIHDGATNKEGNTDVCLLIAGYFKRTLPYKKLI